jgi:hypothetical protein
VWCDFELRKLAGTCDCHLGGKDRRLIAIASPSTSRDSKWWGYRFLCIDKTKGRKRALGRMNCRGEKGSPAYGGDGTGREKGKKKEGCEMTILSLYLFYILKTGRGI